MRGPREQAEQAIAAAKAAFPAWSRSGIQQRHDILKKVGDEILARKDELGRLLSREEGKTLPEGIGETMRAGADLRVLRRRGAAPRRRDAAVGAARASTSRSRASRSASSASSRRGTSRSPFRPGRSRRRSAYGNCVVFKPADLVPGCAWALADILARAGLPDGRVQPGHGPRLGGRRGDAQHPGRRRHHLHRLGRHRHARSPRRASRSMTQVPARDGRQEPAGRARRRRPRRRGRVRGQRRLLLDRPALHGVVAPDRDRGHPRPVRRRR